MNNIYQAMRSLPLGVLALILSGTPRSVLGQAGNEILTVTPDSAGRGSAGLLVTFELDTDAPAAPPAGAPVSLVMIGGVTGSVPNHASQYTVSATFSIPATEALGAKDVVVQFSPPEGTLTFSKASGFTVTEEVDQAPVISGQPQSRSVRPGATVSFSVSASGTEPLSYQWQKQETNLPGATNQSLILSPVAMADAGSYRCIVVNVMGGATSSVAHLTVSTNAATLAADEAADPVYDSGWGDGSNGGDGWGPWQLTPASGGGFFTAASTGNAGGSSGGIDTGGRAWGLWSTNGVTEATRLLEGSSLGVGQILGVAFDNGYVNGGKSVGMALQNAAGELLWEFYFSGGDTRYTVHDGSGSRATPVSFSGDGLWIEFEQTSTTNCLVQVTDAVGTCYRFAGSLMTVADQQIARIRLWNYEAGAGSDADLFINSLSVRTGTLASTGGALPYPITDTAQAANYGVSGIIAAPAPDEAFAGQDAQYEGHQPQFVLGADGLTVLDTVSGLTWKRSPDTNADGSIDATDKLNWVGLQAYAAALNAGNYGGYSDWRLPSIKELYSLMDFRGTDPSGYDGSDTSGLIPYIDTDYFDFAYGDTNAGERIIDAQYASSNLYVSTTGGGDTTLFGVNFADGRIKGYGLSVFGSDKTFYVICCRGNVNVGRNVFTNNQDGTVSDLATGLMWQQADSGSGLNWQQALAYAEGLSLGGYQDWRLPNAKELQSILDYSRSPDTSASAAIDPLFHCTAITNEAGNPDYPAYWTSTTHGNWTGSGLWGVYVCFGRAMGFMNNTWVDVHGAGAQRSDPKYDDGTDYSSGHGPQGDAVRIDNYVRCVRGSALPPDMDTDGDGLSDWYEYSYTTNTTAMDAAGDLDDDDYTNREECGAGTSPIDGTSCLAIDLSVWMEGSGLALSWQSAIGMSYRVEKVSDMGADDVQVVVSGIVATPPMNTLTTASDGEMTAFYRVTVE